MLKLYLIILLLFNISILSANNFNKKELKVIFQDILKEYIKLEYVRDANLDNIFEAWDKVNLSQLEKSEIYKHLYDNISLKSDNFKLNTEEIIKNNIWKDKFIIFKSYLYEINYKSGISALISDPNIYIAAASYKGGIYCLMGFPYSDFEDLVSSQIAPIKNVSQVTDVLKLYLATVWSDSELIDYTNIDSLRVNYGNLISLPIIKVIDSIYSFDVYAVYTALYSKDKQLIHYTGSIKADGDFIIKESIVK